MIQIIYFNSNPALTTNYSTHKNSHTIWCSTKSDLYERHKYHVTEIEAGGEQHG